MLCSLAIAALTVSFLGQQPSVVADPVADFLSLDPGMAGHRGDIQDVYVVGADISGDGKPELFLSHQNFYVDKSGYGWYVYAPVRGGFKRIEDLRDITENGTRVHKGAVRFRPDAFHVGPFDGASGTELISYAPGGGRTGVISGIWLRDNALEERKVRDMVLARGSDDEELYKSLFVAGRGKLIKAKVEDLATEEQRMALIGAWPPTPSGGFSSRPREERDPSAHEPTTSIQQTAKPPDAAVQRVSEPQSPAPDEAPQNPDPLPAPPDPITPSSQSARTVLIAAAIVTSLALLAALLIRRRSKTHN